MSVLALEDDGDANITHFAHRSEFLALLAAFLRKLDENDNENLDDLVRSMGAILDQYLSLPGLLDPALNDIVGPLMRRLTTCLRDLSREQCQVRSGPALIAIGRVVNWVIKVRGWKAVVPQFPSDIHFLPLLADLLSPPTSPSSSRTPATPHHPLISTDEAWEIRSVLLLWLSLLLTVPFNLSALSSDITLVSCSVDHTAQQRLFAVPPAGLTRQVVLLSVPLLYRPGKEGAYAALVLARLYSREDAAPGLPGFLDWAKQELKEGDREGEANLVASIFEILAVLPTLIRPERLDVLEEFADEVLLPHLRGSMTAASSGLIRKLAVKAKGRWWIARLGATRSEGDLPDNVEDLIGDLMSGLGDKDTIVRYSAAKYLARITTILPETYQEQVIGATLALFEGTDDEPVIESSFGTIVDPGGSGSGGTMGFGGAESLRGDARWHGVCLALAELARRGLLKEEVLGETVTWVLKALSFDLRRASHSVGANVRDAAAYLLWSLSRACSPSDFEPFAVDIATALVRAACFDREVGVRRAASAAFQEGVGRLGLYPEGIDVLGKTDFYSVSVRRIAFTTAAPAVATHRVYREALRQHLHNISLRHWDRNIRELGSRALTDLVKLGGVNDLHDAIQREILALGSIDSHSIHGGLLALRELASNLEQDEDESLKSMIFGALAKIRASALVTAAAADVLQAVCEVMIVTATSSILATRSAQDQVSQIIQTTMRRTEPDCQEAVARLYGRLSSLRSPQADTTTLLTDLKSSRAAIRQCSALSLGCVQYATCPEVVSTVVTSLLHQLDSTAKADVETRRYAIRSLSNIAVQPLSFSSDTLQSMVQAAIVALSDYSTDQRGDVGSWIRITGLSALGQMLSVPTIYSQIDQVTLDSAIGGIIKQGVEKLEPCRSQAYATMAQLRQSGVHWSGQEAMRFSVDTSTAGFREIAQIDWFMATMSLLRTKYYDSLVAGLVISIGSSIPSVSKTSLGALVTALKSDPSLIAKVFSDLSRLLAANLNVVRVFVPTMSTITQIISSDVPTIDGASSALDSHAPRIVSSASRGINTVKSIDRLTTSLKLCIALLPLRIPSCQEKLIDAIASFLTHRFPRIRAMTAEQLYLQVSEDDIDPDLEEVLLETSWTGDGSAVEAARVTVLLRTNFASQ